VSSAAASPRPWITAVVLVLAATALTFAPTLSGGFVWDDQLLIVANERVRDLAALPHVFGRSFWDVSIASADLRGGAYYRPVIAAAFAVEFQLFGLRAWGYHAVNVALHLACTLLVARWLLARLRADDPGAPSPIAAAAIGAALFALHPTRVESVAWISGGTDLWATLFALAALGAWQRLPGARGVAGTTLATLAAALCKESALVLPLLLAIERGRRPWRDLAPPSAAVAAVVAARLYILGPVFHASDEGLPGAAARVLSSVGHLLRLVLAPWPPTVMPAFTRFDASGAVAYDAWSVALGALFLVGVAALLAGSVRRPALRPWARDLSLFVVALLPAINLAPLRLQTLVAPRFLYLPLLGVCALVARALSRVPASQARAATMACAAGLLLCASLVVRHTAAFASTADLWAWEVSINPDNHFALKALAIARTRERRPFDALQLSIRAFTAAGRTHARLAQVDRALDVASRVSDLTPEADQETLVAVRSFLEAFAPGREGPAVLSTRAVQLRVPLGEADRDGRIRHAWRIPYAIALARTLRYVESEAVLRTILREQARDALAWRNLLLVTACQERWSDALAACAPALHANPTDATAGHLCEAIARAERLSRAAPADPVDALMQRARLLLSIGARELVRRMVAPVAAQHPERTDLALLLVRADLADGVIDRARARLDAQRARGSTPELDELGQELDRRSPPGHAPP
jgi:tetratricopeptide (TPR) repeat protein